MEVDRKKEKKDGKSPKNRNEISRVKFLWGGRRGGKREVLRNDIGQLHCYSVCMCEYVTMCPTRTQNYNAQKMHTQKKNK